MTTQSTTFKQDLPPEGGYRKLDFTRLPAKQIWRWYTLIPAYIGITSWGIYTWYCTALINRAEKIENSSASIAMMPVFMAEKDRLLLKNLRKIREEEADLMKNIEGWETGTLLGEPIYKTVKEDDFLLPTYNEFYGHNKAKDLNDKFYYFFKF